METQLKDGRKKLTLRFQEVSDLSMRPATASGPMLHKTSRETRTLLSLPLSLHKDKRENALSGPSNKAEMLGTS